MELKLSGKVILVTGSSYGIGFAIAKKLSEEGSSVILNGRGEDSLNLALHKIPGSFGVLGDLTDPLQSIVVIEKIIKKFGRLDGLVCNVGSGKSVKPGQENYDEWQRVFAINLWSTTNIVEAASEELKNAKGAVVCISSICGNEFVRRAPIPYSVAKSALNAYVKCISRPLGEAGVRINAVAPGNILFEGSIWEQKIASNINDVERMLDSDVSLKKLGCPSDISNMVAMLLSPISNFTTGAIFTIDGGQVHG